VELHVSGSTQCQVLSVLLFLYRDLLEGNLEDFVRVRMRPRLPVVMSVEEVRAVLDRLDGAAASEAGVLHEGGLDVQRSQITCAMARAGRIGA